jgi:serine phosphatase RsbU (regulator of sigma subunit)
MITNHWHKDNDLISKGICDLKKWNLTDNPRINLSGEWEFYWQQFMEITDFSRENKFKPDYIDTNYSWNSPRQVKAFPRQGFATYRLKILLADDSPPLALRFINIHSSFELFVNGEKLASAGTVGRTRTSTVPFYRQNLIPLRSGQKSIELIFRVANFHNNIGGIQDLIWLGQATQVANFHSALISEQAFYIAIIFIVGWMQLLFFFTRTKEKADLYLAGFCFLAMGSLVLGNDKIILIRFENISFYTILALKSIIAFCYSPMIFFYFQTLFPHEFNANYLKPILGITGLAILINVIIPPYQNFLPTTIALYIFLIIQIYIYYGIIRAVIRNKLYAKYFLIAYLTVGVGFIQEILMENGLFNSPSLMGPTMVIFMVFHSFVLSQIRKDNYLKLEEMDLELLFAQNIQAEILTGKNKFKNNAKFDIDIIYEPKNKMVGGDYYHITMYHGNVLSIMIADAVGHGFYAALSTMRIDLLNKQSLKLMDPDKRFNSMADYYYHDDWENIEYNYFTSSLINIFLNEKKVSFVNAGHPPALLLREANNDIIELKTRAPIIPLAELNQYVSAEKTGLQKGDILLIFTDGLFETYDKQAKCFLRFQGLMKILDETLKNRDKRISMADLNRQIMAAVFVNGQRKQTDDLILISLKLR